MSDSPEGRDAGERPPHVDVPLISRPELVSALASDTPPALFEVLPTGYWRKHHLPGAISAPPEEALAIITSQVPQPDAPIVVYCWDIDCPMGRRAARELMAAGYTSVRDYHDGKADWIAAGLPMERTPR